MARISNRSRAEIDDEVFEGRTKRAPVTGPIAPPAAVNNTSQWNPVAAPVVAPAPPPAAVNNISQWNPAAVAAPAPPPAVAPAPPPPVRNSGADFLAQVGANPLYGRHDIALNALGKFANFSGDSVTPEFRQLLNTPYGNAESGDYTGNDLYSTAPTYNQDFVNALQGYTFTPTSDVERSGYQITAPDGRSTVINFGDKDSSFDKVAEVVLPAALAAMSGGALAGPLLAGLGIAATPLTTALATGFGSGSIGTAIQGGDLGDILLGGFKGSATAGLGSGVSSVLGSAFAPITETSAGGIGSQLRDAIGTGLEKIGVSPETALNVASYTKPVVSGGISSLLTGGNPLEGMAGGALGQVVGDLGKSVGLTPSQSSAIGQYLVDRDAGKLGATIGTGLAKTAVNSIKAAEATAAPTPAPTLDEWYDTQAPTAEQRVEVTAPSIDNEIGFANYVPPAATPAPAPAPESSRVDVTAPAPTVEELLAQYYPADTQTEVLAPTPAPAPAPSQVEIKGTPDPIPAPAFDINSYLSSLPQEVYNTIPEILAPQQVQITEKLPPKVDDEFPYVYTPSLSGERSDIDATPGAGPQTVTVTGTPPKPEDEFNLPPYVYEIPELAPMPIPEVPASIAPAKPTAPPLTPAPAPQKPKQDLSELFNFLALNQQQPVPSQVLAQMPGFDVDSFSSSTQAQQPNLAALLAAIGYKG